MDGCFYYSGDTGLTLDMQLIPEWGLPGFAVLPIGDGPTMGVEDAIKAAKWLGVKNVVGVHYDTFGFIKIDHKKATDTFHAAGLTLHLPAIGSTIEL
jgi:L-ascorbate metabolism protein UlaG (beta-lactamase superfamily)